MTLTLKDIFASFIDAYAGRKIWLLLKKKYVIAPETLLLILPDVNYELNYNAMHHLVEYMHNLLIKSTIVITKSDSFQNYEVPNVNNTTIVTLSEQDIALLLKYYCHNHFAKIKVISYREPFGSDGLLNKPGITVDYMVRVYFFGKAFL